MQNFDENYYNVCKQYEIYYKNIKNTLLNCNELKFKQPKTARNSDQNDFENLNLNDDDDDDLENDDFEDESETDENDLEKNELETDNNNLYSNKVDFVKNKKSKPKQNTSDQTIFHTNIDHKELNNHQICLQKNNFVYAVDFYCICDNLKNSKSITFNYPGGCVIPIAEKYFISQDDVYLHVCDFNSLYPNVMILHNICPTTVCYNPRYKIKINNMLISPFDQNYFYQLAIPLIINGIGINVAVFVTKPKVKVSETANILVSLNNERRISKKKCSDAYSSGNIIEYQIQHHRQLAIKTVTNALYGVSSSLHKSTYRPQLASMTTYLARLHLVRLNLHSKNFNKQKFLTSNNLNHQPILYGDTDSIFLRATQKDSDEILKTFSEYPFHNNCLKVELEKTAKKALFLAKKSYILECLTQTDKTFFYTKQIFTKMKTQPGKQFLNEMIQFIFKQVLNLDSTKSVSTKKRKNDFESKIYNNIEDLNEYSRLELSEIYQRFNDTDENVFTNNFKMSKDLSEYKSNTQQIVQLKHLSKIADESFLKGTIVEYKNYDFNFKIGEQYGKIDYNNSRQVMFLNDPKNRSCTIMITLLEDYYSHIFKKFSIGVSKKRIFELDTNAIMKKLFKCLEAFNKKFESDCVDIKHKTFNTKEPVFDDLLNDKDLIQNQIDIYLNKTDYLMNPPIKNFKK